MNNIAEHGHNLSLNPRNGLNIAPAMNLPALMGGKANDQGTSLVRFEEDSSIVVHEVSRVYLQQTSIVRQTDANFITLESPSGTAHPYGEPSVIFSEMKQGSRYSRAQLLIDNYRKVMEAPGQDLPGKIIDLVL